MDVQERKATRFRFLRELYDRSDGNEMSPQNMSEIARSIGIGHRQAIDVTTYLRNEGLLEFPSLSETIVITHEGFKEIEKALSSPDEPSTYFPPVNLIVIGEMSGGAIQQGTTDSLQVVILQPEEVATITRLLDETRQALEEVGVSDSSSSDLRADLNTLESQLRSSRPKRSIVRECLISARAVLEAATGTALASGLTQQFTALIDALATRG
ncbi:MAG: hypothetical protein O7H41_15155 [Planctomycetota bacterium]|nr:hypothetical protein [Planctomycetota bacterium]